ncbi:MAG: hypothetical protein A3E78_04700 [Alphaproteobacteria bacterium RIFCSPHIGHO2_12_FULL_63_12]|nr:MAG: hypothetical protein A3E78_04700 [Alphaproteobacteria bacterium RIFCSPHIGHO2_12_FULL_63_12]
MGSLLTIPDLVGYFGVALVVGTYFLSQVGRMESTRALYPALNAVGALMILISLVHRPNPPSIVIEFFWLVISVVGLARALLKRSALKSQERS